MGRLQEVLFKNVPRDVARAIEKILIVMYCLDGFDGQASKLEKRQINTTFRKPIGNPIFR